MTWQTPWHRGVGGEGPQGPGPAQPPPQGRAGGRGGGHEPLYKCTNEGLLLFYVSSIITCIFPGPRPRRLHCQTRLWFILNLFTLGPPTSSSPFPPTPPHPLLLPAQAGVSRYRGEHIGAGADGTRGVTAPGGHRSGGGRVGTTGSQRPPPPPQLQQLPSPGTPFPSPAEICCSPGSPFSCSLASAIHPQPPIPLLPFPVFPPHSPPPSFPPSLPPCLPPCRFPHLFPPYPPPPSLCLPFPHSLPDCYRGQDEAPSPAAVRGGGVPSPSAPCSSLSPAPRPLSDMHIF